MYFFWIPSSLIEMVNCCWSGLAVGIALVMYGRLEEADPLITSLCKDKDAILRRYVSPLFFSDIFLHDIFLLFLTLFVIALN
jgi:hypothetical protein